MPYLDLLLEAYARGDNELADAFVRHLHWGYWEEAHLPNGSIRSFVEATERMCRRVCDAAGAGDGQQILDVGCGIGGTLASLDERFGDLALTGLNIDPRQLEHARRTLRMHGSNTVRLCEGDACELPFDDEGFDVVLALECAFHFPSRTRFLAEARRVLKPGGRLGLCDFMPAELGTPFLVLQSTAFRPYVQRLVGPTDITWTRNRYVAEARRAGLRLADEEDVTRNMLPTYRILRRVIRETGRHVQTVVWGTRGLEWLGRLGILRYVILSFEKA